LDGLMSWRRIEIERSRRSWPSMLLELDIAGPCALGGRHWVGTKPMIMFHPSCTFSCTHRDIRDSSRHQWHHCNPHWEDRVFTGTLLLASTFACCSYQL
jgi:hypothetical protein